MKRTELALSVILVPLDLALLLLAAYVAHQVRFLSFVEGLRPVLYNISLGTYMRSALVVAISWLIIFALNGLYRRRVTTSWLTELGKILAACSAGLVGVVFLVFFQRELFSSRFIILAAYVLSIIFVSLGRIVIRLIERLLFKYGYGAHRVVLVGESEDSERVAKTLLNRPELGYRIVTTLPATEFGVMKLDEMAKHDLVDEVHFIDTAAEHASRILFLEKAERYHLIFKYKPDILRTEVGIPVIDFDTGVPMVELPETRLVGWGRVFKRCFDIIFSLLAIIVFSPLMVILMLAILLESGWPVIYVSKRVGRGRAFKMYKFRSMWREVSVGEKYGGQRAVELYEKLISEQSARGGIIPKVQNDPRVTKVGYWLRRTSMDELPQFFNVLVGNMSLVGPRPHLPTEVAKYENHHHKVLAIKPGITGLAQVSGRSDLDFEEEVRLDRYYIEQWSFGLDLRILLRTVPAILKSRKAL